MLATIDGYTISLFLHISAVVVGFGATYALGVSFPVAMKLDPRHLPLVHALGIAINRWLATPALVVILVSGLYQVSDGNFSLGDPWISASFAILIVLGGMIHGFFIPTDRRLGELVERDLAAGSGELSAEYQAGAKRSGTVGGIAGGLILLAIFLMVTKPGA
jgi:uncharacterized membrane protein